MNTRATLGFLNAMAELPIVWSQHDGCWELINEITGEIFQAETREALLPTRVQQIGYIKDLPYPNIPFGITL